MHNAKDILSHMQGKFNITKLCNKIFVYNQIIGKEQEENSSRQSNNASLGNFTLWGDTSLLILLKNIQHKEYRCAMRSIDYKLFTSTHLFLKIYIEIQICTIYLLMIASSSPNHCKGSFTTYMNLTNLIPWDKKFSCMNFYIWTPKFSLCRCHKELWYLT